jgi:hypothetical protein
MPNMAPRGLWGTPPGATAHASAKQVWACLPTETTYRKAAFVYGWTPDVGTTNGLPGSWQPVWADAARPPASATAAVQVGSGYAQVKVDWVESVPRVADAYRITRPDGTIVADVAYTTLTWTDTDPRPGTGAYTVSSSLAGDLGGSVSTNSVTLGTAPTWIQYPYYTGSIVWQDRSSADGSGMRWYKNGVHWTTQHRTPSTTYAEGDGATAGAVQTYQVCTMVNGHQGACTDVRSVVVPTIPPRPQYLRHANAPPIDCPPCYPVEYVTPAGWMETLVYGPESPAVWDYVEVQFFQTGGWQPSGDWVHLAWVYPSTQTTSIAFSTTRSGWVGACATVRARTYSPGSQISEWAYTGENCTYY